MQKIANALEVNIEDLIKDSNHGKKQIKPYIIVENEYFIPEKQVMFSWK